MSERDASFDSGRGRRVKHRLRRLHREVRDKSLWVAERLLDRRVCVGITGLSGAGKSTLLTSLIYQLSHPQKAQLPGFAPALNGDLLGAELKPALDSGLPPFDYEQCLAALMSQPPRWPESTREESAMELHIHLRRRRHLTGRDTKTLILELRDYPGEWLMDLPLLRMDYRDWCRHQAHLIGTDSRAGLAPQLISELAALDPGATAQPARLEALWQDYRQFLLDCRGQRKLSYLQPGRALLDRENYGLVPMLDLRGYSSEQLEALSEETNYQFLAQRYRDYVRKRVVPFVENHFRHLDRQLVLVDMIGTLFAGEQALDDMRLAFDHIADTFRYGQSGFLRKLWRPRVDRLLFAATKADQVLAADHDNLRQLLGQQLLQAFAGARHRGLPLYCEAIAAVRCSNEGVRNGRRMLMGHDLEGRYLGFENAEICAQVPRDGEAWNHYSGTAPPQLRPPAGMAAGGCIPHIRVDALLNLLLGDKV
ncbi:YcjX family protein [Microbulbifer thermotolerans]|uniref:YcjX family protein n=1 Tax=Microbulbifer thermotolerans TaxID=252514 RepID=A0AB35HX81_MICTH|nr:YcjX family protein [Microbulbifer thermotolerans]MCX2779605.1 YcjX family protein [Microbulbifer thermotolerans]MCX2782571.1 YcjX family protein [Microbulbifer thermotolerans]MCX2794583.1 YcjX family protein [Microbulbifer thermotolerans]MCX2801411.1 YcjX family protein [Microbulbifer thermotolerans]MCX2804964.1 YcjX family protein [Microbulbifer thermotolerans]